MKRLHHWLALNSPRKKYRNWRQRKMSDPNAQGTDPKPESDPSKPDTTRTVVPPSPGLTPVQDLEKSNTILLKRIDQLEQTIQNMQNEDVARRKKVIQGRISAIKPTLWEKMKDAPIEELERTIEILEEAQGPPDFPILGASSDNGADPKKPNLFYNRITGEWEQVLGLNE